VRLYIVRHAIAADRGTPGLSDEERPLTGDGITRMKKTAAGLRRIAVVPDLILSSPLVRARQTAEILIEALGEEIPLRLTQALAPSGTRDEIYEEIRRNRKNQALMLVGHQPSLGELAGAIAWGSPDHYVELKKGGICAIELDQLLPVPRGTLLFLLTPGILRDSVR
jgi:phosphohistidine phosphatase